MGFGLNSRVCSMGRGYTGKIGGLRRARSGNAGMLLMLVDPTLGCLDRFDAARQISRDGGE